jgi:hypothetical protein
MPVPALPPLPLPLPAVPPLPDPALPPLPVPAVPPVPEVELSTQSLFSQRWVAPHARPQLPQLALLVAVSTQAVPHIVCPAEQVELQTLLLQTWLAWQTFVQLPQWVASDGTQEPLQSSKPGWHWQIRLPHIWPGAEQGMPHPPQFIGSVLVFTHWVPHSSWPAAQVIEPPAPVVPPEPPVPVPVAPAEPLEPVIGLEQAATMSARPSPTIESRVADFINVGIPGGGQGDLLSHPGPGDRFAHRGGGQVVPKRSFSLMKTEIAARGGARRDARRNIS